MIVGPLAALVLVACALAWSSFDVVRKFLLEDVAPMPLVFALTGLQTPLMLTWWLAAGGVAGEGGPGAGYLWPALASVAINVVANVLFVVAIHVSPLSVTIPLLSLTPVFTALLAVPVLGEVPGHFQELGIALVVLGAFALHARPQGGEGPRPVRMLRAFLHERGSWMMAVVAFLWSLSPLLDKIAIGHASTSFHALVLSGGVTAGLFVVLLARGRLGEVRQAGRRPGLLIVAFLISAAALALQLIAIRMVLVSIVETVKRGLGNVAAAALGRWVFGERVGWWQWTAVAVMAGGVALILLP
jgi:drug/metabolite transporter (DMT)-like permease